MCKAMYLATQRCLGVAVLFRRAQQAPAQALERGGIDSRRTKDPPRPCWAAVGKSGHLLEPLSLYL